jgi:hypothetical protein
MYSSLCLSLLGLAGAVLYSTWSDSIAAEHAEKHRADSLRQELLASNQRITGRYQVSKNLQEGRLTLLQAAAIFRAIDAGVPAQHRDLYPVYPGKSEGERLCRKVIDCLDVLFSDFEECPGPLEALRARLTAELDALLESSDSIVLPEILNAS